MKVLHINPYPPDHLGGSEIFCKNLAINLKREKNVECDILTSDILKKKIKLGYFNNGQNKIIYNRFLFNLSGKNPVVFNYNQLKKIYLNYDIIHAHSYLFLTSIQSAVLKKFKKFPFILHLHGGIQTPVFMGANLYERMEIIIKNNIFDKLLGKIPIKGADTIISVSKTDLDYIKQKYHITNKTYFIPNGIDTVKFKNENTERKYITFIGRMSYIKGIDIFLKLINALYDADKSLRFLIIGDGPLKSLVLKAKRTLPIQYYKNFSYEEIQSIYNVSKFLIITSRFEGLPTTLLESLACETPVISSRVGGTSEVIINNQNGYLFNINNWKRIITPMINLISDEKKLKTLGKNGRNLILEKYSWDKITHNIYNIYKELLNRKLK